MEMNCLLFTNFIFKQKKQHFSNCYPEKALLFERILNRKIQLNPLSFFVVLPEKKEKAAILEKNETVFKR